jgi:hypothetical protein
MRQQRVREHEQVCNQGQGLRAAAFPVRRGSGWWRWAHNGEPAGVDDAGVTVSAPRSLFPHYAGCGGGGE